MDCSPPGFSVDGILQARIPEWDLPNTGIEPGSPALQADTLTSEPPGKPGSFFGGVIFNCETEPSLSIHLLMAL